MRRLVTYVTACIVVLVMAVSASADDALIAKQIISKLREQKEASNLKGFDLGVQVDQGTVTMMGQVASSEQAMLALDVARRVQGVKLVVNDLLVSKRPAQPKTTIQRAVAQQATAKAQPVNYQQPAQSVMRASAPTPVAFAASTIPASPAARGVAPANYAQSMQPVAMAGGGGYGVVANNPSMPAHAWPSYAASPNYAGVSYPQQYSATAWPYIGPFYPYPQVPLGWRKVSLEWDDGWWFLDFTKK